MSSVTGAKGDEGTAEGANVPAEAPSNSEVTDVPKKRGSIVARLFERGHRPRSDSDDTAGWKKGIGYAPAVILTREQQKEFREQEMKKFELQFEEDSKMIIAPWKLKVMAFMDSSPVEVLMMMLTLIMRLMMMQ